MADLNPLAKRIYNVTPEPVRLTLDDGSTGVYHLESAEFFQREFQGEGTREGDDAEYRFATTEDNERVIVGRKGPDEGGWSMVGTVVEAERAE
ncbi:transcriptional regulator [Halegenticoccus soli]|uniref:transcriptional regulator n=1 Tax=Halegenticoccus soli TaxID=1985678 RepID=UPI000C6E78D4|nr:transcriptional regulator [Halegenticoccus soli]